MITTKNILLNEVTRLIDEGEALCKNPIRTGLSYYTTGVEIFAVDGRAHTKWFTGCLNLIHKLGVASKPWEGAFQRSNEDQYERTVKHHLGALESIKQSIELDLIHKVEHFVRGEALGSLMEQADFLFSQGFIVAAGVLGRCVLEEHLRKTCVDNNCFPIVEKPMLSHYISELYAKQVVSKTTMMHLNAMASTGNDAAHAKPVTKPDVERLLRDVKTFIAG